MDSTPIQKANQARDDAMAGHSHAINLLRERDEQIKRLRDKNARAIRQNHRLSRENAALAARLQEVSSGDTVLMKVLYPGI